MRSPFAIQPGRRAQTRFAWLLIAPAMALLAVGYFYPVLQVLRIGFIEPQIGFDNYAKLVESSGVRRVFWTTLRISAITTLISIVIGYVVSYYMACSSGTKLKIIFVFIMIPFWISVLVRTLAWVVLLRSDGVVNGFLLWLGIIDEPLDLLYNEFSVVIGMIHYMIPVAILTLYGQMNGIDRRLMMAAQGLGANSFFAFRRVFLPLSIPGVIAASILVFIGSLGFYITPALLGGGKTLMLAEYVSILITDTLNWGLGTAMASSLVVMTFALLFLLSRVVDLRRVFGGA